MGQAESYLTLSSRLARVPVKKLAADRRKATEMVFERPSAYNRRTCGGSRTFSRKPAVTS